MLILNFILIISKIARYIEFDKVSFKYGDNVLFDDISIKIKGGEKIALVGYSGAGKSTFMNLIMRINEVESGAIALDKQNISKI